MITDCLPHQVRAPSQARRAPRAARLGRFVRPLIASLIRCVHPPEPSATLGPPGWGGSYAGSKPRCYASHDLGPRAQPDACNYDKPYSASESFEPYGKWPKPHPLDQQRERWDQ